MRRKNIFLILLSVSFLFVLYHRLFHNHSMRRPKIHEHGYWIAQKVKHKFDASLAKQLLLFFKKENATCVDFGSGAYGYYVKYLKDGGIDCEGFDGNPFRPTLSHGLIEVLDLSQPLDLSKKYDWVISLEVGEHLPKEFEKTFIENLHHHNTCGIIISWALEGQSGHGHQNCHNNDTIKKIFVSYGYSNDLETEKELRASASLPWLKKTLMVFRKNPSEKTREP